MFNQLYAMKNNARLIPLSKHNNNKCKLTLLRSLALKNKNWTWTTFDGQENKLHMNFERRNNSTDDE